MFKELFGTFDITDLSSYAEDTSESVVVGSSVSVQTLNYHLSAHSNLGICSKGEPEIFYLPNLASCCMTLVFVVRPRETSFVNYYLFVIFL